MPLRPPRSRAASRGACLPLLLLLAACGSSPEAPTAPAPAAQVPEARSGCAVTSLGLTPLSELLEGTYKGEPGGLYPGRTNRHPEEAAVISAARSIEPRNAAGSPDPNGKYVLVSLGMSNTTQEFSAFKSLADRDPDKDPHLVIVDGAQGGQTASVWANPAAAPWGVLDGRLQAAGVSAAQVTVAWMKHADASPRSGWPAYARTLQAEIERILQLLAQRFPNLRLAYLSSRIYAGYATTALNPEPYAYESAFSVREVIEDQLNGSGGIDYRAGQAPLVAWGPYLWADGTRPRRDGLTWTCSDFASSDLTHPSSAGQQKVAGLLLDFVRTDASAREWFLR